MIVRSSLLDIEDIRVRFSNIDNNKASIKGFLKVGDNSREDFNSDVAFDNSDNDKEGVNDTEILITTILDTFSIILIITSFYAALYTSI